MPDPQDFTDDELLTIYKNPKADLSKFTQSELQRLDKLTAPVADQKTVPHTGLDYYWQAAKDVGEGIGTSVKKTVDAINPFADRPPRPTREQEGARLDAELKNAPPLNFDPRVTGRAIWKGVTNITAKDVGEGIGDVGQMYLFGKAAGAVEPETVRGVINTGLRGADKVGQGITAVGDATMPSAPIAAAYGAMSKSPSAAAVALLPPALKFGGKGISAISRALQSEPPPPPPVPPSPAQSVGMNAAGGFTAGAGATSTGAATPPPAPGAGTQPWTVPQPPRPEPPPVTGTGTLITKPTPGPGTEPWTATRPAEPPPVVPTPTGTASPETVMGSPNVGWNQWTPGRDAVPAPVVPPEPNTLLTAPVLKQILEEVRQQPANEPTVTSGPPPQTTTAGGRPSMTQAQYDELLVNAAGSAVPEAPAASSEPPSTLREQLVASLEKNAPQPAPGVTATEGVKPPPPTETAVPDYANGSGMNKLTPDHLDALGEDIIDRMDTGEARGGGRRAYALEDAAGAFLDHLKNQQGQFKGGLRDELETFLNSADVGKAARTRLREVVQSLDAPATPSPEGESTIPSREQMTPDELSRAREGGRDSPDRQPGETLEDYRLRTRGRATGEKTTEPSVIPARRSAGVDDTLQSMYERNATDQEFRDYLAKSKNHSKNGEIATKIQTMARFYKRASPLAHVIAGAALTGAALRQALVGQLQGDKQQEQD
jgi:hypothetical protein